MAQHFVAQLTGRGPGSAWVFVPIPFDVPAVFGVKGQLRVAGTLNGFPFQNSLLPNGDGAHSMPVNKALQQGAGVKAGDMVDVVLERDLTERVVAIPPELDRLFASASETLAFFRTLSYSHQREYVDWIAGAKQETTRTARAQKALDMLRQGKKTALRR